MKWSQWLDKELFEIAVNIGPWFVPVSAALVFGVSFATAVTNTLGPAAGVAGFFAAIGLEIAGIISFHVSVAYYSLRQYDKSFMALAAGLAYIAIGIAGVWAIDSNIAFRTVGTITFLLIPIVYLSRALAHDLTSTTAQVDQRQAKTDAIQAENRAHEREMERLKLETANSRDLEIARIEAQKSVDLERVKIEASTEPAQSQHQATAEPAQSKWQCEQCQRSFGTVQALNAHKRFCEPATMVNSNGKT